MPKSKLTQSQQLELERSHAERQEAEELKREMADKESAVRGGAKDCSPENHEALANLVLLHAKLLRKDYARELDMKEEVQGLRRDMDELNTGMHELTTVVTKNGDANCFTVKGVKVPVRYVVYVIGFAMVLGAWLVDRAMDKGQTKELAEMVSIMRGTAAKAQRMEVINDSREPNSVPD